jgi:tyrosine-protein kinase Etk/Wzc
MSTNTATILSDRDDSLEKEQQTKRLLFRILPYTPLVIIALLIGTACSWFYLRYATRIYAAKARVIVNDDTQQKNGNLLDIVQLDTRNLSAETEREMQILSSRDLLGKLVSMLQLNVQYSQKGYVKTGQYFKNLPFELFLEHPDSIESTISGGVEIVGNKVRFNGALYPVDTLIQSGEFGRFRWHINPAYKPSSDINKWFVTIQPVSQTVNMVKNSLSVDPITKQSSILELSYIDALPDRGINILNNLITLYGTTTVDYKSRISANTLNFLDSRLRLVAEELSGVEKNLQVFKTKQGIVDLGTEGNLFLNQVKDADSKIG